MPPPLDIDREPVRMMVLEYGVAETSRRTGIHLSTIKQWSARGGWLDHLRPENAPTLPKSMQPVVVTGVTKPCDAVAELQRADSDATRSAALRYSRRTVEAAAQLAEAEPLKALVMAGDVKASTQTAALAAAWERVDSEPIISLSFFTLNQHAASAEQEQPVIDV